MGKYHDPSGGGHDVINNFEFPCNSLKNLISTSNLTREKFINYMYLQKKREILKNRPTIGQLAVFSYMRLYFY